MGLVRDTGTGLLLSRTPRPLPVPVVTNLTRLSRVVVEGGRQTGGGVSSTKSASPAVVPVGRDSKTGATHSSPSCPRWRRRRDPTTLLPSRPLPLSLRLNRGSTGEDVESGSVPSRRRKGCLVPTLPPESGDGGAPRPGCTPHGRGPNPRETTRTPGLPPKSTRLPSL